MKPNSFVATIAVPVARVVLRKFRLFISPP